MILWITILSLLNLSIQLQVVGYEFYEISLNEYSFSIKFDIQTPYYRREMLFLTMKFYFTLVVYIAIYN